MVIDTKLDLESAVLHQLGVGKENALPGKVIAQRCNEKDTRRIRMAIIELLRKGICICGDSANGYYIADNVEDAVEIINRLHKAGLATLEHYSLLRKAAEKKFTKQLILI